MSQASLRDKDSWAVVLLESRCIVERENSQEMTSKRIVDGHVVRPLMLDGCTIDDWDISSWHSEVMSQGDVGCFCCVALL